MRHSAGNLIKTLGPEMLALVLADSFHQRRLPLVGGGDR